MRMGKYEMGRALGEGHFGKVRLARHADTGATFAIKILDRQRILAMKIDEQIKREIATLNLLKHPNVIRLHEVSLALASLSSVPPRSQFCKILAFLPPCFLLAVE
ncbi:hypothetical protein GUJ93_ZPchr0001g29724 [Zizania palustris]|uniref:Protein kinase domain-containing protein n=1 Tax=Zizania palustris TaxID=103762 RepID=A0A8J5VLN7_ZIZPA|nr:hypothetical protein GUJ93_ZPchr0001g29724 [Zizania palustris]